MAFVISVNTLWSQFSLTKAINPLDPTKGKNIKSEKINSSNHPLRKSLPMQKTILGGTVEKLDSLIALNYNASGNTTTPNFKHINTFDQTGNLIVDCEYNWSSDLGTYIFGIKNEYTYNAQGKTLTNTEFCDTYELKNEYTYDMNGNNSILIECHLDSKTNTWKNNYRTEYVYNGSNIQTEIEYDWDSYANNWNLDSKTFHFFDSSKNDTLLKRYNKDYSGNWNLSHKLINHYTYNETGSKTAKTNYDISYSSDSTTISYAQKNEFTYDNYGNMLTMTESDYKSDTRDYTIQGKYEFGYDISKNLSEVSMGNLTGLECNNKLTDYKYYTYTDSKYVLAGTIKFYYSNRTIETGNAQIANQSFWISPNPVTEYVKFNVPGSEGHLSVVIINLQGKTVLEKQVENNAPLNINYLNKGLYLYKVTDNTTTYNGKIILK